ncbi:MULTISPECIES: hypothetical protein [unclassified Okeania]|nr:MULTISPECIES: hypothetical protein [unclassified Okeania]
MPAPLRNAHQEKRMISDLKNGIEAIPIRLGLPDFPSQEGLGVG